jgi:hypothetical protein
VAERLHDALAMTHSPSSAASCSCHSALTRTRELIRIRASYRYRDRAARDSALSAFRTHLERDVSDVLSVECRAVDDVSLSLDLTLPMFSHHDVAADWCELLARTAIDAGHDVRPRTL